MVTMDAFSSDTDQVTLFGQTEASLREYSKQMQEIEEHLPLDYVSAPKYESCLSQIEILIRENPQLQNRTVLNCLQLFDRKFPGQWKRMDIILRLLRQGVEMKAERLALEVLGMIVDSVDVIEKKNVEEASKTRRQIGLENRINMLKYYDPIRKHDQKKSDRIHVFRKQFDLYWNDHSAAIQQRSQKKQKEKSKEPQQDTSSSEFSIRPKERPCKRYPAYFANFRTGFYRWEKKYEKDTDARQAQERFQEFIDKLKSMAPEEAETPSHS